jgi:hypothetical protein
VLYERYTFLKALQVISAETVKLNVTSSTKSNYSKRLYGYHHVRHSTFIQPIALDYTECKIMKYE